MFIRGSEELYRNFNLDFRIDDEFDVALRKQAFIYQISGLSKAVCISEDPDVLEAGTLRQPHDNVIYPRSVFPTGNGFQPTEDDLLMLETSLDPILEGEMLRGRGNMIKQIPEKESAPMIERTGTINMLGGIQQAVLKSMMENMAIKQDFDAQNMQQI